MSLYRLQLPNNKKDNRSFSIDDDIIRPVRDEDILKNDFNSFLSYDDSTINTKSSKSNSTTSKKKKKKKFNNRNNDNKSSNNDNKSNNDDDDDEKNNYNDNKSSNNETKDDNNETNIDKIDDEITNDISENREGSKLLKRLNYFWGNVKRNSTKVKFESSSKKATFAIKEEKIRQSLIRLFQLQYERELKEKEEKASKRMTRRLLALIISEKRDTSSNVTNTNTTSTNNNTLSTILLPSIFQKRK